MKSHENLHQAANLNIMDCDLLKAERPETTPLGMKRSQLPKKMQGPKTGY